MGWTDLSTWDGNYQSLDFLNEYIGAVNERARAMDRSRVPFLSNYINPTTSGYPLVGPGWSYWLAMFQGYISTLMNSNGFIKHLDDNGQPLANVDGSTDGLSYLNAWTLEKAAPIFTGVPGATSFRRYNVHPDEGGQLMFGSLTAGDIVGRWIFEDFQRAINLLVWTSHWGMWPTDNRPKAKAASGSSPTEALTNFASAEEYEPGYGQTSWFNYYHYVNNGSYTVQTTRENIQAQWSPINQWGQLMLPAGPGVSGVMEVYATPFIDLMHDTSDWEFDDGGFGLHETTWKLMQSGIAVGPDDEIVAANQLGTTNYVPGNWPTTKHYRGYIPAGVGSYPRLLCKWNVPGGFEYVEE